MHNMANCSRDAPLNAWFGSAACDWAAPTLTSIHIVENSLDGGFLDAAVPSVDIGIHYTEEKIKLAQ